MTDQELKNCCLADHLTCKPEDLMDLKQIPIAAGLPVLSRMEHYWEQVKNPYLFRVDNLIVKVSFSGKRDLTGVLADLIMRS